MSFVKIQQRMRYDEYTMAKRCNLICCKTHLVSGLRNNVGIQNLIDVGG